MNFQNLKEKTNEMFLDMRAKLAFCGNILDTRCKAIFRTMYVTFKALDKVSTTYKTCTKSTNQMCTLCFAAILKLGQ